MTHTYQLTGMTCEKCEAKVKSNLLTMPEITSVELSKDNNTATISMDKHISISRLQNVVGGESSKYQINVINHNEIEEKAKDLISTYKPLLLVFAFISGISLIAAKTNSNINWMSFMNYFMAAFFISFSFFKLLDLKGFAESYEMYDVVAMRINVYGFIYPFLELALGISYLTGLNPVITNISTVLIMGVSSIGVIQSVMNKKRIQCACLGSVFNLPMSTVTIVEDFIMIGMALLMLTLM